MAYAYKANDMQLLYYKIIFENISKYQYKNNDINIAIDINPVSTL